jgi:hypothetical protein
MKTCDTKGCENRAKFYNSSIDVYVCEICYNVLRYTLKSKRNKRKDKFTLIDNYI